MAASTMSSPGPQWSPSLPPSSSCWSRCRSPHSRPPRGRRSAFMVMVMDAYLFDVAGFRRLVTPIVAELTRGEVALLRSTAFAVADAHPHIWRLLGAQKFNRSALDQAETRFPDV